MDQSLTATRDDGPSNGLEREENRLFDTKEPTTKALNDLNSLFSSFCWFSWFGIRSLSRVELFGGGSTA